MEYDVAVIIPTFNEEGNIEEMIYAVDNVCREKQINETILVVDDNSPDNTQDIVKDVMSKFPNVDILVRYENHGLSQSIFDGFMKTSCRYALVIDADFTHPPEKIPEIYYHLKSGKYDLVMGSKFLKGSKMENWPPLRSVMSYMSGYISRILFPSVTDPGSGFFGIDKKILEGCTFKPRGFRMAFEILGKGNWTSVVEIPETLRDRTEGKSKLSIKIILIFFSQFAELAVYNLIKRKSNNVVRSWKIFLNRKN